VTARLAVAFIGVALAAVALFAALTLAVEASDVSGLARTQAHDLAHAAGSAAAAAYRVHGTWAGADVSDALAVASAVDGSIRLTDASGRPVAAAGNERNFGSEAVATAPVTVDGHIVGSVRLAIGPGGVSHADSHLRHVLALGLAGSAAAAALLAIGAAIIVAERITRPLRQLTATARARTEGRHDAKVGLLPGAPRELAELAEAYDAMATTVAEEDRLRRASAAHVAHELRTPAAIILATTEGMLDGVIEANSQSLSSLRDEGVRLSERIDDLESLAVAEAARLNPRLEPTDLAEAAAGAADALDERFADAGVDLRRHLDTTRIAGDPSRLHQIVTNLLTNAAKFSPGGSTVRLTVGHRDEEAVLEVSDAGPGIDPDEIPHLFEPFWRGRSARGVMGSGIGLAVVAELVAAHGGRIDVRSTPGHGTEFRVTFPTLEMPASATP
jgi:two-component system, OmpR family, sensor histidine kinase BaeS